MAASANTMRRTCVIRLLLQFYVPRLPVAPREYTPRGHPDRHRERSASLRKCVRLTKKRDGGGEVRQRGLRSSDLASREGQSSARSASSAILFSRAIGAIQWRRGRANRVREISRPEDGDPCTRRR